MAAQRANLLPLGSLRSHDGDAEDNVDQKMNIYFTYESRKSFTLSDCQLYRKTKSGT